MTLRTEAGTWRSMLYKHKTFQLPVIIWEAVYWPTEAKRFENDSVRSECWLLQVAISTVVEETDELPVFKPEKRKSLEIRTHRIGKTDCF